MSYRIAIASGDAITVDTAFGATQEFLIYEVERGEAKLSERRACPVVSDSVNRREGCQGNGSGCGCGIGREINHKIDILQDCRAIVCSGIGSKAEKQLNKRAVSVFDVEGIIEEILQPIIRYYARVDGEERRKNE